MKLEMTTLINLLRSDGSIVINKKLVKAIGLKETVFYSELLSKFSYFKEKGQLSEEGYFYSTIEDIEESTGLTRYMQAPIIKKLKKLGLIDSKIQGVPATRYFKVLDSAEFLIKVLEDKQTQQLEEKQQTSLGESNKLVCGKTTSKFVENQQEIILNNKLVSSSSNKEFSEIKKVFDQNIHPITPIEAQKLIAYLDDDGMDYRLIIKAIEIAVCNSKRYLAYIEGILKRWRENNLLTLEAVEAYMRDYQNKQSQGRDKQFDTVKSKNQEVKSNERNKYTGTTKESTSTDQEHREYTPKPPQTYGLEQLSEEELKEWMRENGIF